MQSLPSTAAQIIVTIIPIVGIVMGSAVIFFFMFYTYKLKSLMIEKGIAEKRNFDIDTYSLFAGIILVGVGICLTLFFVIKEGAAYSVLGGIIPLSIGLSLITFFIIRMKINKRKNDR
ncbi:MAG: hypothetical protein MUC95_08195 [Spirochaetes bacterium]|jgi:hypothetical protein|nr:hypothetical protein [Spirochaetota bacterium]